MTSSQLQGGSRASENRYGNARETNDRSSPNLIEYLAIGFVAMAVAFGPAIAMR